MKFLRTPFLQNTFFTEYFWTTASLSLYFHTKQRLAPGCKFYELSFENFIGIYQIKQLKNYHQNKDPSQIKCMYFPNQLFRNKQDQNH